MKFYYQKKCKVCENIFFKKSISEDMLVNAAENPVIDIWYTAEEGTATITSTCTMCPGEPSQG
jgi:hypothetical protein